MFLNTENTRPLLLLCLFTLFLFSASIPWRMPHVDDAWLGEHSYWLAQDGVVKSKLMTGIAQSEERLVLHHKLHTWLGASIIQLVGFDLHALKASSLIFFIALIAISLHLGQTSNMLANRMQQLLLLLLLFNPLIFEFAFVFRPETLLATLGMIGFLFLYKAIHQPTGENIYAALSGIFAGLALLTHLNGSMFIAAGFICLMLFQRFITAIVFGIAAILVSALYFADFKGISDFALWYNQLTFIPTSRSGMAWWQQLLLNLRDEHMRYFHSPKEIVFSLLIIFTLFAAGKKLWQEHRLLLIYTLLSMFFLGLLALHKTSKYLIPLLPFWSLMIVWGLHNMYPLPLNRQTALVLLTAFFVVSAIYQTKITIKKYDPALNEQIRQTIAGEMSPEMRVAAPMEFIFNEIDNFEAIQGIMAWTELRKLDPNLKGHKLLQKAYLQGIDLILLNKEQQHFFGLYHLDTGTMSHGYQLIHKSPSMMAWRKIPLGASVIYYPVTAYNVGFFKFSSALN